MWPVGGTWLIQGPLSLPPLPPCSSYISAPDCAERYEGKESLFRFLHIRATLQQVPAYLNFGCHIHIAKPEDIPHPKEAKDTDLHKICLPWCARMYEHLIYYISL